MRHASIAGCGARSNRALLGYLPFAFFAPLCRLQAAESEGARGALTFIEPGKPTQNACIESFNGKFRDECLNENWFSTLADAREKIAQWKQDYNQARPHSALGYRTPEEFAKSATARNCGKDAGYARLENAARFPLSHSLDGYEKVVTNVASETQNPEKVSLSLD